MTRSMLLEGPGCVCDTISKNILSLQWLLQRPSILLWADEILVSSADYEYVLSAQHDGGGLFGETAAQLFSILHTEGIVRLINPDDYLLEISRDSIEHQVQYDLRMFGSEASAPNAYGNIEPSMVQSGDASFCGPMLESMYTNLLLSNLLGCSCLVDDDKAWYLFHRFDRSREKGLSHGNAFDELYSVTVPELRPYHDFHLFCPESRSTMCLHVDECMTNAKSNVRKYVDRVLYYRTNKEIRGLSNLVERFEEELNPSDEEVSEAVVRDIIKAQNRVSSTLPQVEHWCEVVTGIASAVAVANAIASDDVSSTAMATTAGISFAASKISAWLKDRQGWKITYASEYIKQLKAAPLVEKA